MAAVRLVERAQPDEPVLAALGLEDAVRVLAADGEGRRLEAGLLPGARLEQLDLEAAIRRPALVHPEHHLGPVLRVRPPGARLERHDGVAGVVLTVEERGLLQPLELLRAAGTSAAAISSSISPPSMRRQLAGVVVLALQRAVALETARDACVLG